MYRTVSDSIVEKRIDTYLSETIEYPGTEILKKEVAFINGTPEVSLVLFGERIPENLTQEWSNSFEDQFKGSLVLVQDEKEAQGVEELAKIVELYSEGREEIRSYQEQINILEGQLDQLEDQLIPANLASEIKINYPELTNFSIGTLQYRMDSTSNQRLTPVAFVQWQMDLDSTSYTKLTAQLKNWLEVRLNKEEVLVELMP